MAIKTKSDITEKEWNALLPTDERKEDKDGKTVEVSALRTLCNIFIVIGFIQLVLAPILLVSGKPYLTQGLCCLVGCIFLLFYGYIGKCLDDIRNNTKK